MLAVMAVLLTIAVPSYRQYAERAERAEAIRLVLATADCQERIRAGQGSYDTTRCLETTNNEHYGFRIEPAGIAASSRFHILAEPVLDEKSRCGTLGLDHTGTRSISAPNGTLASCWGGR